jgi:general secretion pathway protein A
MYETYFRLRESPFKITPDPRFFYVNASHREAFATLCYGVERRKGITVITGEAGTGKTILLRRFVQNLGPKIHSYYVVDPHLNFIELLQCASEAFGLAQSQDRLMMLQQLKGYSIEQLEKDHIVALLFDEAQDLNNEVLGELGLLSDWESGGENLLQIVLVGHLELESRLAEPSFKQLKQRVALRSRVAPLSHEDVCPYIQSRLSTAGYAGGPLFATSAIERIALHSKGIPRLINVVCDNALLIACATSQKEVAAEIIEEVARELQIHRPGHYRTNALSWGGPQYAAGQISEERHEAFPENRWRRDAQNISMTDDKRDAVWVIDNESTLVSHNERHGGQLHGKRKSRQRLTAFLIVAFSLGLMTLFLYRHESMVELASVARPVEKIKQAIEPIPGWIQRILTIDDRHGNITNENSIAHSPRKGEQTFPDLEFRRNSETRATPMTGHPGIFEGNPYKSKEDLDLKRTDETPIANSAKQIPNTQRTQAKKGTFVVTEKSFVRGEPTANAEIIATLPPGARVQVVSRKGDYWRIRSLGPQPINGYVHQEDAFFEPRQ